MIRNRYFILLVVISVIFSASVVVVSTVSKEVIIDVYLELDNMGGHGYQRYDSEDFPKEFGEYILKFTSRDNTLKVDINDSEGQIHNYILFPPNKRIKFIGEIDYIGLSPSVSSCSFHFRLLGVKFDTTYAYYPLGVVYGGLFIFIIIMIRKDFSSEDDEFIRTKEY